MPAGARIAFAIATLIAGLCAALAFRKSDSGGEPVAGGPPLSAHVTRRLTTAPEEPAPTPFRLAPHPDSGMQPPPAALVGGFADAARSPSNYEGDSSPIGALLQPINNDPAPLASAPTTPGPDLRPANDEDEPAPTVSQHRIVDGDTLSKLAAEYLGSSERYLEIFECNRDLLKNPNLLPVGKTLRIPPGARPTNAATMSGGGASAGSNSAGAISAGAISAGSATPTANAVPDGWRPVK